MQEVALSSLVLDYDLYPRHAIDSRHVRDMRQALAVGAEYPPLVADKKTRRLTDGFHRYKMYKAENIENVFCVFKTYKSDSEMLLDAVRLNGSHGKKLSDYDRARIFELGAKMRVDAKLLADAMHVTLPGAEKISTMRMARDNGHEIPIKMIVQHMAGKKLNKGQVEAMKKMPGIQQLTVVNTLIRLIETDMLDIGNEKLMDRLSVLKKMLRGVK